MEEKSWLRRCGVRTYYGFDKFQYFCPHWGFLHNFPIKYIFFQCLEDSLFIATKTEDESLLLNEGHRTEGSIELQLQCIAVHGFVSKWVK